MTTVWGSGPAERSVTPQAPPSGAAADEQNRPYRGILFLIAGVTLFSVQDVVIKSLSGAYAVHEIVFFRSIGAFLPVILLIYLEGGPSLFRSQNLSLSLLRGFLAFLSYSTYYLALAVLSMAEVVTLFYSSPLFITALSVWVLRERVGPHRWLAVALGFVGVLVVIQPGSVGFEPAMILAILAALFYAFSILITRHLGKTERGSTMSFYSIVAFLIASALAGLLFGDGRFEGQGHESLDFLFRAWVVPPPQDLGLLLLLGLIAGLGFYCLTQAYRVSATATVAPFEYASLPWAVLWGYVFWGDIPGINTLAGIALIVGGGLYIIHRESVRGRKVVTLRSLRPRV